jgi:hypothetical protein
MVCLEKRQVRAGGISNADLSDRPTKAVAILVVGSPMGQRQVRWLKVHDAAELLAARHLDAADRLRLNLGQG